MSSTGIATEIAQPTSLDLSTLAGVERLAQLSSSKHGHPFKAFSKNALSRFANLPAERKYLIDQHIQATEQILSSAEVAIPLEEPHDEWHLIERALGIYGLHLKDDYQNILQKDDVIEIYNQDHIQIFRTFNFFQYSAYSYLDLLSVEWFNLWERPSHLLQSMMAFGQGVVSGQHVGITSLEQVPQHVYKEIYNSEDVENFQVRSVLCKFGHTAPLYKADNTIGGFIVNCRVKVLAFGEDTQNLSFL